MYQQEIFDWNANNLADKMNNLEFRFQILPFKKSLKEDFSEITLWDKPSRNDTDEQKLREKYFYKQAYFYEVGALKNADTKDLMFVPGSIDRILMQSKLYNTTESGEGIYESNTYCLNIEYRYKNATGNEKDKFKQLYSYFPDSDLMEQERTIPAPPPPKKKEKNPFKPQEEEEPEPEPQGPTVETYNIPCLVQFNTWREKEKSQFEPINFLNENLEQISS
jgi:hypothetical protein